MASRKWSLEQRLRQSEIIHSWRPWEQSTGAKTTEGKAKSSRNAFRYTIRKGWLFQCYLLKQSKKFRCGENYAPLEEIINRARRFGINLLS